MVPRLRHRHPKGAATVERSLSPPRHISTLRPTSDPGPEDVDICAKYWAINNRVQNLANIYFWNLGSNSAEYIQYHPRAYFGYLTMDL
jgi:hypothetical protein